MSRFCVTNLGNNGLFLSICALNRPIFSPEKFNPDLIRASSNAECPVLVKIVPKGLKCALRDFLSKLGH